MNNLGAFLLKQYAPEGLIILGLYTWFPNALALAAKHKKEGEIIQVVRVRLDWSDNESGESQIYERRWDEGDKRWVETWFDESYKPPPEPAAPKA